MAQTHTDLFESTIHLTHKWINEIAEELGTDDRYKAYQALRSTLHALRDRMPVTEAAQLGAQLPLLINGVFFDGWKPVATSEKFKHAEELFDRVRDNFAAGQDVSPEAVARAVFRVLGRKVTDGELEDISAVLQNEISGYWQESLKS